MKLLIVIKLVLNCLIVREVKRIGLVVINVLRCNGIKYFVKILKLDFLNVESFWLLDNDCCDFNIFYVFVIYL